MLIESDTSAMLNCKKVSCKTRYLFKYILPPKGGAFLFAFPSHYANEAHPLVVLEAMAAGVPGIASDIATLPEFIRDEETGFLCPPQNPTALAETIIRAIEFPDKTTNIRNAAYEFCKAHFNQDRFATQITSLMREVIESDAQNRSKSIITRLKSGERPNGS